jgi:Domain of unknown function (DUF5134)
MAWVHGGLAALCLAVGGLHLWRAVRHRSERVLDASYAVMALGMAAMFSPLGDPVPAAVWVALFLAGAAWFGAALLRAGSVGALGGEAVHLVVGSAAMLFMLGADHRAVGVGGGPAGHAAHGSGGGLLGVASAVALVFAAYFVLHTLRCADRWRAAANRSSTPGSAVRGPAASIATATRLRPPAAALHPSWVSLAHLLMTAAMAFMLIGMI